MTPSGLSVSPYVRLKPAFSGQLQPAAVRKNLYFGGGAAKTTDGDTLEKTAFKTEEELAEEEEERIRALAEERINQRYSAEDIAKLDKRNPAKRRTLIEERVEAQRGWIRDKDEFVTQNHLEGIQKHAVEQTIEWLKANEKEQHSVYEHIHDELRKLKPSAGIAPHLIQQQALVITEDAMEHPKDKKGELVEAEMARIKNENAPSLFARPGIWVRDGISNFAQNAYFTTKDTYKTTVGTAGYYLKRGAKTGQDVASAAGSMYLSHKAGNYFELPAPYSMIPPVLVGFVAPMLGNRQKQSFVAGAALHGLGNAAADNLTIYGVKAKHLAHGASALAATSALIPNTAYSTAWNSTKSMGAYASSLAAFPFVKAASWFSRPSKAEPAIKQKPAETAVALNEHDEDALEDTLVDTLPETIQEETEKPAAKSKSMFSFPSLRFWSSKASEKAAPAPITPHQTEEEIQDEIGEDLRQAIAISHGDPQPAKAADKKSWSLIPSLGGWRKTAKSEGAPSAEPVKEKDSQVDSVTPLKDSSSETDIKLTDEAVLPTSELTAEKTEDIIKQDEAKPLAVETPATKPKTVAPAADTQAVEKVAKAKPKPRQATKPEPKKKAEKTALQRYAWPAVHVTAGSSLIAGGALLQLPIITAPVGMGMMAAGSAWAIYGIYKGFQAAQA